MLLLKTNQLNKIVCTVSQNAELANPEWLFSFTHKMSKERVTFILPNLSTHQIRYDEFEFIEGQGPGKIAFPYEGQYIYGIYEQYSGSTNLDPALAYNKVESGLALMVAGSAMTTNDYYIEYISNDEDNSNIIFAPGELNPPSPTPTTTATNTPTPTQTPTNTNTPTNTQTPTNTPTFTSTPTSTPTPSITATNTPTTTQTPTPSPGPLIDPDAAAYLSAVITAGGTLSPTISAATNTLFVDLKSNGIFSTLTLMYPLLGGTSSSTAINAKSPGTNNITWFGGMSFGTSGATGNGTTGYGDTSWTPTSTIFNDGTISVYTHKNLTGFEAPIASGPNGTGSNVRMMIFGNGSGTGSIIDWGNNPGFNRINPGPYLAGLYVLSSTGITRNEIYWNGATGGVAQSNNVKTLLPNTSLKLFKRDDGFNFGGGIGFASAGGLLTTSQMATFSNLINTWATTIGRNTY